MKYLSAMFLDFPGTIALWSQKFDRVASFDLGIQQQIAAISYSGYFLQKISLEDPMTKLAKTSQLATFQKLVFLCLIICYVETLQYLEICLMCVSTFIFVFPNFFSRVPGGLRLGATVISYTGHLSPLLLDVSPTISCVMVKFPIIHERDNDPSLRYRS